MSKKKDDPVTWGDLILIAERLARVENEVMWLKESLKEIKSDLEKVLDSLGKYKWWILSSILSVWILTVLIRLLLSQ